MRWSALFILWNLAAFVIFLTPHALVLSNREDLYLFPVLILAAVFYLQLRRVLRKPPPNIPSTLLPWAFGFHLIFWAETVMEAVIFTAMEFHNTDANDPYFIAFWALIGVWLLGGWRWLKRRASSAA